MSNKPTDTSEKGLEARACLLLEASGWKGNYSEKYNTEYGFYLDSLISFLVISQPDLVEPLDLKADTPTRHKVLKRIQDEISRRGIIDVLRNGVKHNQHSITLFYGTPTQSNATAVSQYERNLFSVSRQVHFSGTDTNDSLDLVLSLNGLPIFTFELKNQLTNQNYLNAINQYKEDRNPSELIFKFKRTIGHFAVDDSEAWFTTRLNGKDSWFLPFNKGFNDGAGNPVNPDGLKTDYLWNEVLQVESLVSIIENYCQVVEIIAEKSGYKSEAQIFPRFHQLEVVRNILADVQQNDVGKKYLIQHSAGSGKSNSIAWLAHQLVGIRSVKANGLEISKFDTVIVITDRKILDKQISETIKQYAQVSSIVGRAGSSQELRTLIEQGKKIIISTIQKFPHIMDEISDGHRDRNFAIIIDEAHSSQGGKATSALSSTLRSASDSVAEDEIDSLEDLISSVVESRRMLTNASYFAFTATPKNKTLELFGCPFTIEGIVKHRPFHTYSMKQAIQEGFILDVLKYYTPVQSYYRLEKKVDSDPEFDVRRSKKKLRKYVEGNDHAISVKASIMVDHFLDQVIAPRKIGGKARAMIVTSSIERAIQYFRAVQEYLLSIHSPYKAIVAFSGEPEFGGKKVTEAGLNGFPSNEIADKLISDPYRFLIVADKFQTGYDEPLLHTMYVDKPLHGIRAVQTLSRLNRAHPKKYDCFVLDFYNDVDVITDSFASFYRTTILSDETDPNKLHNMASTLVNSQIFTSEMLDVFAVKYLKGADRGQLDPILDASVVQYLNLQTTEQIGFKATAKSFLRMYGFLSSILDYVNSDWEKLSIFLNFLVPKLPAPDDEDLAKGILQTIDMDSYRVEKLAVQSLLLPDSDSQVDPIQIDASSTPYEPVLEKLSMILKNFNDLFGNIDWSDKDRIAGIISKELPVKVALDERYIHAMNNSDRQNARIEHDAALQRVMNSLMQDQVELFKQFMNNQDFKSWLQEEVFKANYENAN
jgi:type I restriction enzyme R subunit